MKKLIQFSVLIAISLLLFSCGFNSSRPQKVFDVVGLNANSIPSSFERHFKELFSQKENGSLKIIKPNNNIVSGTAVEYVNQHYVKSLEGHIQSIKDLKTTEESQPIIDAGLDLFKYSDEIYKTDYPKIAKMIDEGKSQEEVMLVVQELDSTKGVEVDKKYKKMMELLIPYADENGVEYKVIDLPF